MGRNANPDQVDDFSQSVSSAAGVDVPTVPAVDQNALANIIENGATFVQENTGNLGNIFDSIFG